MIVCLSTEEYEFLWVVKVPCNSPWTLGKSYVARPLLRHKIGQGHSLFFRHDSWYPDGFLFPKFGHGLLD